MRRVLESCSIDVYSGSGKTTLMSLICSDHPQSYTLPIKIFGRSRLPVFGRPGISIFDIQNRMGQSSPEVHAFFPRHLTLRQTIENAWAETFLGIPKLCSRDDQVIDSVLQWFEPQLNPYYTLSATGKSSRVAQHLPTTDWADKVYFRNVSFSSQRVALFLRAVVKKPELVVLDEAFSGMDEAVRDKCMRFLEWGNSFYQHTDHKDGRRPVLHASTQIQISGLAANQALICISHVKEEVPNVVKQWICLPEPGTGKAARFGLFHKPLEGDDAGWNQIWGM